MKYLVAGVALATACSLVGATRMPSKTLSKSMLGPIKISLGLAAVMSKKSVKATTTMQTKYSAGYIYAPSDAQTLVQQRALSAWNVAVAAGNVAQTTQGRGPATWSIMNNGVAGAGAVALMTAEMSEQGRAMLLNGRLPVRWAHSATNVAPADVAAGTALLYEPISWAQMAYGLISADGITPADTRAVLAPSERVATAESVTEHNVIDWGLRPEVRVSYAALDNLEFFIGARYLFTFSGEHTDAEKKTSFTTKGVEEEIQSQSGRSITANLVESSFRYNSGVLASDVTVKATAKETFSFVGGLQWCLGMVKLNAVIGMKRYALEAMYSGGDYAYPGTVSMFPDEVTKVDGHYRLLVEAKGSKRTLKATAWPVTFGGGVSIAFAQIHNLVVNAEYSCCTAELKGDVETPAKSDGTGTMEGNSGDLSLAFPYNTDTVPTAAQLHGAHAQAMGTHQFGASEVVNTVSTKLEVHDFTVDVGYMLTL